MGVLYRYGCAIVGMSALVYACVCVCVGSSARNPTLRSHMFAQKEKGGSEYYWIWCRLKRVWMTKWWRVWCHWQHCANSYVQLL